MAEWFPIKGQFEGFGYVITKDGQVKSKNGRILTWRLRRGYALVALHFNKRTHYPRVRRLVAETFIPREAGKLEVNHKDANKLNNHVDNLEWSTRSHNMTHARRLGLCPNTGKPRDLTYTQALLV